MDTEVGPAAGYGAERSRKPKEGTQRDCARGAQRQRLRDPDRETGGHRKGNDARTERQGDKGARVRQTGLRAEILVEREDVTGAELERARERWGTEGNVPIGSGNRAREKGRLLLDRGRLSWWKEAGQRAPRDRQEPCGQKDSVTDGWEVDLRKGGGGRCKEEEKTREQAER